MKRKSLILVFLIVVLALSGSIPPASLVDSVGPVASAAQPQLIALAARQPDAVVSVIVQKTGADGQAEAALAALGGRLTKNLSIINAFAAHTTAAAALQLARQPGVRWVSLDAAAVKAGALPSAGAATRPTNTINATNGFRGTTRAGQLQREHPEMTGQGITVALVDSGITPNPELEGRVLADVVINGDQPADGYGHGTHIAGIIAGTQRGVAPGVNLVNVKVSDDQGGGMLSDVVAGLQWVYENKDVYNIRVVNLSINSSVVEHYTVSPLDAACEMLWFNGIVVVVSSGNNGKTRGILYPPANDPFVITVGSVDDQGTAPLGDDLLSAFTAAGKVQGGFYKPEVVAPGEDIYSLLSSPDNTIAINHPEQVVDETTLRLSGTSMSAGVVSGAVALLLQSDPGLTPDQVKNRLRVTGRRTFNKIRSNYIDIHAAVETPVYDSANVGTRVSKLLSDSGLVDKFWSGVAWNSVAWNSVAWNSVAWNSVSWNSVAWNSLTWDNEE